MKKILAGAFALLIASTGAFAQTAGQAVLGFLLTQGSTYNGYTCPSTNTSPCFVQYGDTLPTTGGAGTIQDDNIAQVDGRDVQTGHGTAAGTLRVELPTDGTGVVGLNAGTNAIGNVGPASRTLVTLDVKTVTTGGTAVTALTAGHRNAGGLLCNPQSATVNLGVNEIGTASGTTSSGDTTFIVPGQCYVVSPASTAVSVITSDSSHPFSGYGLN